MCVNKNNDQSFTKKLFKIAYDFIPFKRVIYSALKTIWTPGQRIHKHLHFKGIFNVHIYESFNLKINHYGYQIENEIFWSGLTKGWEKESINLWIKLCVDAEVVFDIGANTGVYSGQPIYLGIS